MTLVGRGRGAREEKWSQVELLLIRQLSFCSSATPPTSLSHMARMMDSLLLDSLSPIAFTKITTTNKPPRNSYAVKKQMANDIAQASHLHEHSHVSTAYRPINNLGANAPNGLGIGGAPVRNSNKQRLPTQGMCSLII